MSGRSGTDLGRLIGGATAAVLITAAVSGCAADVPVAAVRVRAETDCALAPETGMGIALENGLVLTAAHVVGAAGSIELQTQLGPLDASVVAFDPDNDLALLRPTQPLPHGWRLADGASIDNVERGAAAFVYVERDGAVTRLSAEVIRPVQIETEDIYIDADVSRPGWELRYPIEPGDSGAAVIVDGEIIGVVWARSRKTGDRAYAIDPIRAGALMARQLDEGRVDVDPRIDLGRC